MARKVLQESVGLVEGGRSGWAVMQENSACRRLVRQHQSQARGDQGDAAGAAVGGKVAFAQEVEEDEHQRPSGEGEALAPPDAGSRRFLQVGEKLRRGVSERRPERRQRAPEPARVSRWQSSRSATSSGGMPALSRSAPSARFSFGIGLRRIAVGGRVQPWRRAQLATVGSGTPLSSAPIAA